MDKFRRLMRPSKVGKKGIYFKGSSKNEGNRKSKAMFGIGNTEHQYIDYGAIYL